jgi:hypothetical protein
MRKTKRVPPSTTSTTVRLAQRLGLLITALTICLSLLGYGFEWAYLLALGITPESLGLTPIDYLLRSWYPVLYILDRTSRLLTIDSLANMWAFVIFGKHLIWLLVVLPCLTAFGAFFYVLMKPKQTRKQVVRSIKIASPYVAIMGLSSVRHSAVMNILSKMLNAVVVLIQIIGRILERLWAGMTPTRWWAYSGSLSALLIAALCVPILYVVFLFMFGGPSVGVALLPLLGAQIGLERADRSVLNAQGCEQPGKHQALDWRDIATCVRVLKDGKELDSGYFVDQGGGQFYVFRPCINQPISFARSTITIEHIGVLPYKTKEPGCKSYMHYKMQLPPVMSP